ncbi:MAG: TonB-dependent receptor plug domain-containing protein [Chitinophagaceae bacterium]
MKKLSLAICYILLNVPIFAQKTFKGKVTDASNGLAVPGATVEFENNGTVVTDANGIFNIYIPPRSYVVKISSVGYKMLEIRTAFTQHIAEFKLERYNLFLQPVEIRAIRAGDKAPFAKTDLNKKDIEKNNLGQDLPFLLNQTPSVVINSDAGNGVGYTGIRIRGSDPTRINVTLNGIPYNDAESQGSFFVDLPDIASSLSSIQVQRGVGTSSNGAGAFGATINVASNEFREDAYTEINNSYGSFNTWKHTVKAGTGLLNDHFTIDARLSKISSDGYIERATSDLRSFYISTAYINKKSTLRLNILSGKEKTYQAWNGILQTDLNDNRTYNSAGTEKPGEPYKNETDNYQQDHYQLFFNHQFSDQLSFNTAVFLTRGKGYYEQYKAGQSFANYGLPDTFIGIDTIRKTDLVRQLWLDNYFYGNILSLQYHKNNSQFTVGSSINRYEGNHYGNVIWSQQFVPLNFQWYHLDSRKTDASVYAKLQQKLANKWEAFLDLQYRRVNYELNGFRDNPSLFISNKYNFINPKAGINYTNNHLTAFLSYAKGNKEPNRDDFEAGILNQPKAESLHDFELGVEKKFSWFSWALTGYYMLYKNQLVLTGKINDVGAYTRTNIPNSYRAGIEMQAAVKVLPWLNASGNLTLSNNKVKDFSEYIDDYDNGGQKTYVHNKADIAFSPNIISSAMLHVVPVKNGEISFISKYVGRQYLDNTGNKLRSLSDFYLQDVRLMYTFKHPVLKETRLIVQVNNLFNRKYEPNGYTYSYIDGGNVQTENYLFPMAGTNWMLGVEVRL